MQLFDFSFLYRPELFSYLAQQLQSADVLSSHRISMILFRCLKELSSKRLVSDQRNFAEVLAVQHYTLIYFSLYCNPCSSCITCIPMKSLIFTLRGVFSSLISYVVQYNFYYKNDSICIFVLVYWLLNKEKFYVINLFKFTG